MHTIQVELLSDDAYELLRQLEKQQVLRLVPYEVTPEPSGQKTARTLVGGISPAATRQLLTDTAILRDEWE